MTSLLGTSSRYLVNVLCRRRGARTLLAGVTLATCALLLTTSGLRSVFGGGRSALDEEIDWDAEYEKARQQSLREHMTFYVSGSRLQRVPDHWTARDHCPACFGTEMCSAVDSGDLLVDVPSIPTAANRKGVYQGRWKDVPVVVKRLSDWYPPEFKLFDEFVCRNVTGEATCDVSAAVVDPRCWVQRDDAMTVDHLRSAWRISYAQTGPLSLTYALCLTTDLVQQFSRLYTAASSVDQMSPAEKAMMYTSMVVQPESLMLKFLKDAPSDRLAPRVYGACGRMVVVEHGGRLLETYLNASFHERADLALQLISLMKMIWHADQRWFGLYNDVQYENIAVTHFGQVYLVDYEHLHIIQNVGTDAADHDKPADQADDDDDRRHADNEDQPQPAADDLFHDDEHGGDSQFVCNADCFDGLFANLSVDGLPAAARQNSCRVLHEVSLAFMYSALCRNILLDDTAQRDPTDKTPAHRGLLHDIPNDEDMSNRRQRAEESLQECVHETKPGGRLDAIDSLSEILSLFTGLRLE